MNIIFCLLTGGHQYSIDNIRVNEIIEDETFDFVNWCTKCGKRHIYKVPRKLYMDILYREYCNLRR